MDWQEKFDKNFYLIDGGFCSKIDFKLLKNFISNLLSEQNQQIKQDLLKIADDNEIEDLRRVVEDYFK